MALDAGLVGVHSMVMGKKLQATRFDWCDAEQ